MRGIIEGVYQAVARSLWVSPAFISHLGAPRAREELLGLGYLLDLRRRCRATSRGCRPAGGAAVFGITRDVRAAPEDGAAFVSELQQAFGQVRSAYSGGEGHTFRLALACYPQTA